MNRGSCPRSARGKANDIIRHLVRVFVLSALLFTFCVSASAQQTGKVARIGVLPGGGNASNARPRIQSLRGGLGDLGYDGRKILIEDRYIEKSVNEYPGLVSELLQFQVDVIVVEPLAAIRAAKENSRSVPIVIVTSVDPVANGLVESLARPGGNITGVATLSREISGKRLELFKEMVPRMSRIGILGDPDTPIWRVTFKEYEAVARAMNIQLQSLEVRSSNPDLEKAFQTGVRGRADGVIMITNPILANHRKRIADLALKNHLPLISDGSGQIDVGFLMSYLADIPDQYRRAAAHVDKILRGVKPADLPVEQARKFALVINLKRVKQIGLTIPANFLARADKVIR